ncbi:hypothetical protein VD659_02345 [Herbiconiux sp. 11R-BC]|uniref:hypothetical protein n=1 Tax=Herbiconiux sp. 11R-BC TaxID=3111637 RepID=UPI003C051629
MSRARDLRPPRGTTALELDPLAAISARGFLIVVAVVSLICAVGLTLATREQISSWPMAIAAVVALAGGYAWFARSAFRGGAGVTSDRFALAFALIALGTVLNSLSCLGTNVAIRDDWGLVTIGLALMAAAPFRTSSELGVYAAISVALAALLAVVHIILSFTDGLPPLIVVTVAVAPALAFGLASAAYARELLAGIYAERLMQAEERNQQFDRLRQDFVDDDVVGEIGGLRAEVVPFLARIRQSGVVTAKDRALAGRLAQNLQAAVTDSRHVDSLGDHAGRLIDESGLSPRLHEDDRATIRALLIGLETSPLTVPGSIVVEFIEGESDRFGMVRCASDDVRALRAEVLPFLRMVRLMFRTASEQVSGRELLVQFDIERLA